MEQGGGIGAYGSGSATGNFDFVAFIKKPQVILRSISWLFSVVVFGCISSQAMKDHHRCAYGDYANCEYGVAVGVIAFLGLLVFLVLDALFDNFSNVEHRKYIVIADIAFSGLWSFMWFVCFCLLADKWRTTQPHDPVFGADGVQAAIAFSFFSIATFVALTVLAVLRYRKGISDDFLSTDYDQTPYTGSAPYSGSTEQTGAPYQASNEYSQSPFATPQDPKPVPGGYQQQTY